MRFPKRILIVAAMLTALSSIASGYYHFVYFAGNGGPFNPINLQFDLTQLTNNTVYYFISDQGPDVFVPGDSFTAVISELQLAAQAWNNVPTSQIKLAYGGLENAATQQSAPGIDVVFTDDIPAGILAQTKVTTYANVAINGNTTFLPILRSRIQLRKNLTVSIPQQASFYDSSFTTMVHEFGHSLGLQHTLTSACMSTYITRSTTKAAPLAPDDVAGMSLLYPTAGYLATTGSINGIVTMNGSGVNLASVVALSTTTGAAISSLTNPDGTYTIGGVPPGQYYLYVHPLPPAAQGEAGPDAIVPPQDPAQDAFPANTGFVTQFFPGTRDWTQATQIGVSAGNTVLYANFNVQASAGPVVYGMELSGGVNNAVEVMPMLEENGAYSLEFTAPGTTAGANQLAPGLSVSVIGSSAPASVVPGYTRFFERYNGLNYVSMGVYTGLVQSTTPVAIAVTVSNDLYVLPAAFYVVPSGPPAISALTPGTDGNGNGTLTVAGSSLSQSTQIVFDGTPANLISVNSDGSLTLSAPSAPANYSSSIEALNPDGQTSGEAIPFNLPPQYVYGYANPAAISLSAVSVLPGTDALIEIYGNNTNFNSQTVVGFGSSDIVVKQVFVENPGLLLVNASMNPQAPPTAATVTVTTGLQAATSTLGMQILAANPSQISMVAPVTNALTGLAGVPAGGSALITVSGIQPGQNLNGWTLTIGQQQMQPTWSGNQLLVNVPGGMTPGAVTVQLTSPTGATIPPIAMKIDAPPPVIISIANASGTAISSTTQVHPGDVLTLNMGGLGDNITPVTIPNLFVSLDAANGQGGMNVPVTQLNGSSIQVQIPFSTPDNPSSPITVGIGTRVSAPVLLNIHN